MKIPGIKTKEEQKPSRLLAIALIVVIMLFILSTAIRLVIICRPFYYAHISALALDERAGITVDEAKQAYGEMLDYCLGYNGEFRTGVLHWSEAGKAHFDDCKFLFSLDHGIMLATDVLLLAYIVVMKLLPVRPAHFRGKGPAFWGGVALMAVFVAIAAFAATGFDRFFVIFHSVLFPGKTNWIFDWDDDAIIRILPEVYFRNCGIAIVALLIAGCVAAILLDRYLRRKEK